MAVKVENGAAAIEFGTMGAQVTVTHVRIMKSGGSQPALVKELGSEVVVNAQERLRIPGNDLDIIHITGEEGTDAYLTALLTPYWGGGESFLVDCMTDANTPVSTSGYSQQTVSNFTITTVPNPTE